MPERYVVMVKYIHDLWPTVYGTFSKEVADRQLERVNSHIDRKGLNYEYTAWIDTIASGPVRVREIG